MIFQKFAKPPFYLQILLQFTDFSVDLLIVNLIFPLFRPMLVAGLLTSDQLAAIFLNADELIQVNAKFCEVLRDAIDMAFDSGDEDLTNVHVGKLFLESLSMLRAFESYCTRQVSISKSFTNTKKVLL